MAKETSYFPELILVSLLPCITQKGLFRCLLDLNKTELDTKSEYLIG